jgi:hypothetical protein
LPGVAGREAYTQTNTYFMCIVVPSLIKYINTGQLPF